MKKELLQNHIRYFLTALTLYYILFLACGYFSIFTGQYHQPHLVLNIIVVALFLVGIATSLPKKKALAVGVSGVVVSAYFAFRFIRVFDFSLEFTPIHLVSILFPAVIGAVFSIGLIIIKSRKKATA